MSLSVDILFLVGGIFALWVGGELLLRGAIQISLRLNMSRTMVGLTIVALGTSLPELFVCLVSLFRHSNSLSVANILGSNILNIGLILPLIALVRPIKASHEILAFDLPVMLASTLVTLALMISPLDVSPVALELRRSEGVILLGLLLFYFGILIYRQRAHATHRPSIPETTPNSMSMGRALLFIFLGIAGLQCGAYLLVAGATSIAELLGVSERLIGLTIVALGTSLPELFASIVAVAKKEPAIVLGNIVGSNIMNFLFIVGFLGVSRGIALPYSTGFKIDMTVLVGMCTLMALLLYRTRAIRRWGASFVLAVYISYWVVIIQFR